MINQQSYKAYAAATQTVAKTKQIVMLYDATIKSVKHAHEAIEQGDIETRYNSLVKAGEIIFGLQGCLDFEAGGEIAQTLFDFYSSIDARLMSIHRTNDAAVCQQIINELKMMRDAWVDIDKMDEEGTLHGDAPAAPPPEPTDTPPDGGCLLYTSPSPRDS